MYQRAWDLSNPGHCKPLSGCMIILNWWVADQILIAYMWNTEHYYMCSKSSYSYWTTKIKLYKTCRCHMRVGQVISFHNLINRCYSLAEMRVLWKWKALKCQTLGAAVHVIGLVCWLESITASWLAMRILFCSCLWKVRSQISDALCRPCATYL